MFNPYTAAGQRDVKRRFTHLSHSAGYAPAVAGFPASETPLRVLVVEDHADVAANIGDYLAARGHTPDFAVNGQQALHLVFSAEFDVIVLDIM